jgi:hypothetical protein
MSEPTHTDGPRFERRDIKPRPILQMGIGIALLTAIAALAMFGLFRVLKGGPPEHAQAAPPQPPEPRLQKNERSDLARLVAAQRARLTSYGWVDRSAGIVHIPIDEALRLVAQRGLPVRATAPTPSSSAGVPTAAGGIE